ncbi:MAG: AAA family ATPase [Planctomycetota bacterium]|nr:AAA family ATPase [Planctomycetota bacterium]MEC8253421.1 AAA family ATPase [Planctomycetota bacterium]MEC8651971.1 AAA family ATPase [Planctomycetota bacterium]
MTDVVAIAQRIQAESQSIRAVRSSLQSVIVGQDELLDGLLIALLADGHVLLEGLPGLAKSLAVNALARSVGGEFRRIQFTPDLLPADLVGTHVYNPKTGDWQVKEGPVFANFVLADEINRAPAKVQSALLEAMQERQVTLAGETRKLPSPFLVLATQNPVEQEGTYALPEAQVDRFLVKLVVGYPSKDEELQIIDRMASLSASTEVAPATTPQDLLRMRELLDTIYLDDKVKGYIVDLVFATREPERVGLEQLKPLILYGASPRASLALARTARARAFLEGRGFVTPQDVKAVGTMVLRHRVLTTYEAEAEGVDSEAVLRQVFDTVPVP